MFLNASHMHATCVCYVQLTQSPDVRVSIKKYSLFVYLAQILADMHLCHIALVLICRLRGMENAYKPPVQYCVDNSPMQMHGHLQSVTLAGVRCNAENLDSRFLCILFDFLAICINCYEYFHNSDIH